MYRCLVWFQSAVRAAVNGRVLILEGIEKAERNVLPVLNNLLENREMQLDDGRFLTSAAHYDKLLTVGTLFSLFALLILAHRNNCSGSNSSGNVGCVLHNIRSPSRLYICSCALLLCDWLAHATLFWLFWSRCWQLSSHRYQLRWWRSPFYWWSNEMGLRFSKFWGISSRYGSPHKLA